VVVDHDIDEIPSRRPRASINVFKKKYQFLKNHDAIISFKKKTETPLFETRKKMAAFAIFNHQNLKLHRKMDNKMPL